MLEAEVLATGGAIMGMVNMIDDASTTLSFLLLPLLPSLTFEAGTLELRLLPKFVLAPVPEFVPGIVVVGKQELIAATAAAVDNAAEVGLSC